MHIDRMPVYRAYQRAIDLELYHAFAELVVQTSQDNTAGRTYRQIKARQIWQPVRPYSERICQYNLIMAIPCFAQSQKLPAIRLHVHIGQFHQCAQRQICFAPVFLYLFSIETDKPLKRPKIDSWEDGSVLRQQSE